MSTDSLDFILTDPNDFETQTAADVAPLRCQFDGCTNGVTKPARGRTPKYCDDHKGNKSATQSPSGGKRSNWANSDTVEKALAQYFEYAGAGVAFLNETDGLIIGNAGPALAHELVELAKVDKKFRPILEKIALPGKYGPLMGVIIGGIIIPVAMNHGLLDGVMGSFLPKASNQGGALDG